MSTHKHTSITCPGVSGPDTNSSRAVIGIVVGLIILIVAAALVIYLVLKTKPELVDRLKGKRGGAEESVKRNETEK